MTRWLLLVSLLSMFALTPSVHAHLFLNSAEPQCNGTDSTVIMCDDYEDGDWFVTNVDNGGANDARNDGWGGTIWATDPLNQKYARCGAQGAVGTNCTATTAFRNQSGKGGQAWHRLGPQIATKYMNVYHREYLKFLPGYKFGHEKWTFYEDGTIQHGLTQTPFSANKFDWAQQQGSGCPGGGRCPQNQGNDLSMVPGRWYYMETHLDLANGIVEFWQDDCGTTGLDCKGPGTLRLRYTGLTWKNASAGCCNFHQENWCPAPGGAGECAGEVYRDQTVWATRRIGPMGVTQPPPVSNIPPVTGLKIFQR